MMKTTRFSNRFLVRSALWGVLILAGLIPVGCATLPESAEVSSAVTSQEARAVLEGLQATNEKLKNFKGIGRLTIKRDGKIQMDDRVAWIGSEPLRLSVVLFASGFPAIRMASDGEWLYYQDGQAPGLPVKKIRTSDPDFERLLSIPIQSSDILALLRGRIPIRDHRAARLQALASGNGYVLLLERIWGVHQKIFLDERKTEVQQIEVYDISGNVVFQANFLEMQRVEGYRVPSRLVISNHQTRAMVQLVVEKFWADIPITPSMFVLEPPG
jgi:hypothetical protein